MKQITFLGAGSMAEAIIGGLLAQNILSPKQITVTNFTNEQRLHQLAAQYDVQITTNRQKAVANADIIIFAMKPYGIKDSILEIKNYVKRDSLFISILAGVPTHFIEDLLGFNAAVIRTMPNTSAFVKHSATAITSGRFTTAEHLTTTKELFEAVGTVLETKETKLDAITGLTGSGPAYVYYFIEGLYEVAHLSGLSQSEAHTLITETIIGVGQRLKATHKTPEQLYREVMSPSGTTEAGFQHLEQFQVQEHFKDAVLKAIHRSKELGQVYANHKHH